MKIKKIDTSQNQEIIRIRNQKRVLRYVLNKDTVTVKELADKLG